MLRIVLLALVASLASSKDNVVIKYEDPLLSFTWSTYVKEIDYVVFHYAVKNSEYEGWGVLTTEGWQFQTRDINLEGADLVEAYATAYDVNNTILLRSPSCNHTINVVRSTTTTMLPSRRTSGPVIFRDDFNSFDTGNWKYEISMFGGMNWEFQVYTNDPKNVFVRDGNLHIQPFPTTDDPRFNENFLHNGVMNVTKLWGYCTNENNNGCYREGKNGLLPPIMSGKIMSIPTLRYGIVEVRAKIPKGDWIWPAIWMMPRDSSYGGWPRSGEIDIMESRGNDEPIGVGTVSSTLHWGPAWDNNRYYLTSGERRTDSWHDSYHTWRLEWTPDYLSTFVDDQRIMEVLPGDGFWQKGGFSGDNIWAKGEKMAPFDKDFYMIFNVAVGGTNGFFPDHHNWVKRKPWDNNSPRAAEDFWNARNEWQPTWQGENAGMLIDWVEFRSL